MTRLRTEWISAMKDEIRSYDDHLKKQTGTDLKQLAAKACGVPERVLADNIQKLTVAVIPITSGQGIIGSFADSVAAVAGVMGARTFVTEDTDVGGIYEAADRGSDILFMADDDRYIAMNIRTGAAADNNMATAMGYVAALEQLAGTLKNKSVLVMGCGIVGRCAIKVLEEKEAIVSLYDKDRERVQKLNLPRVEVFPDAACIRRFDYILDATSEGGWLRRGMLKENAVISAPGVPLSLDREAYELYRDHVVHDCLQIGTAVMLGLVL